jgi:hypothetical protein
VWANPNAPNLADYTLFVQFVMGVPMTPPNDVMPSNSPYLQYALNRARNLVIGVPTIAGSDYTLAVYNCAGHIQLTITPDVVVNGVSRNYFDGLRKEFDLLKTVNGVLAATSDQGTSFNYAVPEALQELTIEALGFMKTTWGRTYLSFNQDFGPNPWGLT